MYINAANQGHAGACYELARLYFQGHMLLEFQENLMLAAHFSDKGIKTNVYNFCNEWYNQADYVEKSKILRQIIQSHIDAAAQAQKTKLKL